MHGILYFPLLCKIYGSDFAHGCFSYAWQSVSMVQALEKNEKMN